MSAAGRAQARIFGNAVRSVKNVKSSPPVFDKPISVLAVGEEIVSISTVIYNPPGFPIPQESGDANSGQVNHQKYAFLTITNLGTVSCWRWAGHYRLWEIRLNLEDVVHGILVTNKDMNKSILFVETRLREKGYVAYRLIHSLNTPSVVDMKRLTAPLHHFGYCQMAMINVQEETPLLVLPLGLSSVGVMRASAFLHDFEHNLPFRGDYNLACVQECRKGLMFVVPFTANGVHYILCGSDNGTIRVIKMMHNNALKMKVWDREVQLSGCYKGEGQSVLPLCAVYAEKHKKVIVGTASKAIMLLNCDVEKEMICFDRCKMLLNKGIACIALHADGNLVVTGGWDGNIRLFELPSMTQVKCFQHHLKSIRALLFIPFSWDCEKRGKYFILCGAEDGTVSSWNLYPSLKEDASKKTL